MVPDEDQPSPVQVRLTDRKANTKTHSVLPSPAHRRRNHSFQLPLFDLLNNMHKHNGTFETKGIAHYEKAQGVHTTTKFGKEGYPQARSDFKGPVALFFSLLFPLTTILKGFLAVTKRPLWQQQPSNQASCISWHNISRAMWQLKATLPRSQSSRKSDLAPQHVQQCCPRCVRTAQKKKCLRFLSMTQRRFPCLPGPETDYHLIPLRSLPPAGANQSARTPRAFRRDKGIWQHLI